MKLDIHTPTIGREKLTVVRQQQKELTLLDAERKQRGHILFEYNKSTGEIKPAEYMQNETYQIGNDGENKVHTKQGCVYVQDLNQKNALRKIQKLNA